MSNTPELSVVVPAYNEQNRLEPTLRSAISHFREAGREVELLVIDDGSRDGTSRLVQRLSSHCPEIRLIRLPANRGKGYAVRTGIVNACGGLVLFMDADGSTPIGEVSRLEAALRAGADVAIGSRAMADREVIVRARIYRRLIGRSFHYLVQALTVQGFHDTQCGFKLFRAEVAHDLFSRMRMNGFSFDVEVLLMAKRGGYSVVEVPVNWTHCPGSRVNLVLDSLRMARDLFFIRAYALRGDYDHPHVAPLVRLPVGSEAVSTIAALPQP